MSPNISPEDLALFALQLLPPDEMATIQAQLQHDSDARAEFAEIQGDLALVALSVATEAPAAGSRDRLLQQIGREARPSPIKGAPVTLARDAEDEPAAAQSGPRLLVTDEVSRRNPVLRVLPWLGWAAAATLAVTTAQMTHERDLMRGDVASVNHQIATLDQQTATARRLLETLQDPAAERVTLTLSKQRPVPQGKATYNPAKGALVFVANNLEPLEPQKTYELWIIPANGQAPIPAGVFHPDEHGNANVLLPKLPVGVAAKAFGVTIESEGGATTPTMPIILAGAAG